tara:strand:- start:1543 stop:2136 length:594 start_codon:yes stop_codon:yes gene_type:complete
MVSEVDICNRGLIKVHAPLITSLTQDSPEAILCNAVYDQIRDEVLRAHFWNFAIKQVSLEQLTETPVFEFDYKYALPADYVRVYRLENPNQRYKIKSGELHTNQSTMKMEYVAKITDTTKFDPMFVTALSLRIGAELAYPLAGSNDRYRELLAEYEQYIKMAKRADGQEGTPDSLTADLFVDSRHEYGGSYPVDWTR